MDSGFLSKAESRKMIWAWRLWVVKVEHSQAEWVEEGSPPGPSPYANPCEKWPFLS